MIGSNDARNVIQACKICHGREGSLQRFREMMFGSGRSYRYFLCAGCGCLQLCDEVSSAEQYPSGYYAYRPKLRGRFAAGLRRLRNRGVFRSRVLGWVAGLFAPDRMRGAEPWFRHLGLRADSRILDVGCGTAELLRDLADAGYCNVLGIDPYLPRAVLAELPSFVRAIPLDEVSGEYDVIMFHHSLEHMPDQEKVLRQAAKLLRPGGVCLVRIPVFPSFAWDRYRENWVQLDAPRHLFVHSRKSLGIIAKQAGLEIERVDFDSTEFQFTGSELYSRGLALSELERAFSRRECRAFRRQARQLNRDERGDQAVFFLRKAG